MNDVRSAPRTWRQIIGLFLGPIAFAVPLLLPVLPTLEGPGRAAAATTAWMAIWWITEAIPISATALLPIVLFPLTGVLSPAEATAPYANPLIFLFLGGFLLSAAIQKWGLHRRIALRIILAVGLSPRRIVLGFMAATAFLSMWISNTATALMMVPIGLAVVGQMEELLDAKEVRSPRARRSGPKRKGANGGAEGGTTDDPEALRRRFGVALMLGVAYGASIGGLATLIGSPPNAIFAGFVETTFGETIGFLQWMYFGLPLSVAGLAAAWLYLTRIAFPLPSDGLEGAERLLRDEHRNLGPMSVAEKRVALVFGLMAALWILRGLLEDVLVQAGLGALTDTTVAVAGGLALFVIGSGPRVSGTAGTAGADAWAERGLLQWEDTRDVPWGILILFGGGLTLARGIESSGAALWLAERLAVLQGTPPLLVVAAVTTLVLLLTEVSSNTATATVFMPVTVGLAGALGVDPKLLMIAAAVAASCAFMLPVATPPNAIVFGSGYVDGRDMLRAGFWLNLGFIGLITAFVSWWLPAVWGLGGG